MILLLLMAATVQGDSSLKPKLREIEVHPVRHADQQGVLLRDPLRLSDQAIFLPLSLVPLLELCDGSRDEAGLRASLAVRAGIQLGPAMLGRILAQLDEALLLDNERFAEAQAAALQDFRTATSRTMLLAGESYPGDAEGLGDLLDGYLAAVDEADQPQEGIEGDVRGLISPHIDYERGGAIYAQVWCKAALAVREADLAIIFATDHLASDPTITLTHQRYATPWGVLPTANEVVDRVARAVGPEVVFRDELHHRSEHSIELAAVWLHYLLGDTECQLLPVLCGSFDRFVEGEQDPREDASLAALIGAVSEATGSQKTMVIAAGDLAHVGPAFGDPYAIDLVERARLRASDEELMASICAGDEEAFFQQVKEKQDRSRVCGLAPIYLALWLLGEAKGTVTGYAQCPADQEGNSFVSICGISLS